MKRSDHGSLSQFEWLILKQLYEQGNVTSPASVTASFDTLASLAQFTPALVRWKLSFSEDGSGISRWDICMTEAGKAFYLAHEPAYRDRYPQLYP